MSNKFAPTIIAAEAGHFVAEPRYGEDNKTFDTFELIPIVAWMITPKPATIAWNPSDPVEYWTETRPVTANGWNACVHHPGWMIKFPDGRFMDGDTGDIFADEKEALAAALLVDAVMTMSLKENGLRAVAQGDAL